MEKEKRTIMKWIRKHKRELIIAGISIPTIIGIVIALKNLEELKKVWENLFLSIKQISENSFSNRSTPLSEVTSMKDIIPININATRHIPHDVAEHLRKLPEGWQASALKKRSAAEHGYILLPGQTWVKTYRTGENAA